MISPHWLVGSNRYNLYNLLSIKYIPMKKTLIIVLVVVLLVAGWILYFYRDAARNIYNNTQQEVSEEIQDAKQDMSEGFQEVKEDMLDSQQEAKEDTANQ